MRAVEFELLNIKQQNIIKIRVALAIKHASLIEREKQIDKSENACNQNLIIKYFCVFAYKCLIFPQKLTIYRTKKSLI